MQCPMCGSRVEGLAKGSGRNARCPSGGATLPRPAGDREPEIYSRAPDVRIRRPARGTYRFLNATTIGALLGFVVCSLVTFVLFITDKGVRAGDALLAAFVGPR